MKHPIDDIKWIEASDLKTNAWNPNVVFTPEMELLESSILDIGWAFPILTNKDNIIIDGHHRWWIALNSDKIREAFGSEVPCSQLDVDIAEAMITTVRMNRAKGSHIAIRMSSLVISLHDEHGKTVEEIAEGIGAPKEEVELLLKSHVFKTRDLDNYEYSKAWVPVDISTEEREKMVKEGLTADEILTERDSDEAPDR